MKKMIRIDGAMLPTIKRGAISQAIKVKNLRQDRATGALIPVGNETVVAPERGTPLLVITRGERKMLVYAIGKVLKSVNLSSPSAPSEIGVLGAAPQCAVATDGSVVVMTSKGAETLVWDEHAGRWSLLGEIPEFPAISIVAADSAPISTIIEGRKLSGAYPHGSGALTADDAALLSEDCTLAYDSLCSIAAKAGYYLQPLLACYRILDRDGGELYRSAPVLVGEDSGFQCVGELTAAVEAGARAGAKLSARGWRMAIVSPERLTGGWGERAAAVEILATSQLHPVRLDARVDGSMSEGDTNVSTLSFTLPGVAVGEVGHRQRAEMVVSALDRRDSMMRVVARYSLPFAGGLGETGSETLLPVQVGGFRSEVAAQVKSLAAVVRPAVGYQAAMTARCALPHRFTATAVAANGDTILWGNPVAHRFKGYPLPEFAVRVGQGRWRASVVVEMADSGERVVWSGEGDGLQPMKISPLLTYPSGDAVAMRLSMMTSAGEIFSETLPLTATPKGDIAYYLHPSLGAWFLSAAADSFVVPDENSKPLDMGGRVLAAKGAAPLAPVSVMWISPAPLVRITAASRGDSAWSSARAHFYAFSDAGIWGIGVNSSQQIAGASLVTTLGVDNPCKVAAGLDAVWAMSGHGVLKVSGNKARMAFPVEGLGLLGWNPCRGGELWLQCGDEWMVVDPATGRFTTRDSRGVTSLICDGGEMLLIAEGGLLDATREVAASQMVEWKARVPSAHAVGSLRLDAESAGIDAVVSLRGDGGAGDAGSLPILKARVKGMLNAPVSMRLVAPRRSWLDFAVSGSVDHATSIHSAEIISS